MGPQQAGWPGWLPLAPIGRCRGPDLPGQWQVGMAEVITHGLSQTSGKVLCGSEGIAQRLDQAAVQNQLVNVVSHQQQDVKGPETIGVLAVGMFNLAAVVFLALHGIVYYNLFRMSR